jgi:Ala-tRNA(Pro) deacylase
MPSPSPPAAPEIAALDAGLPAAEAREAALYARFRELGIAWQTFDHVPVFTVEEAQALRGALPGTHTKNLFLQDRRGGLWLVVAREELRVDLNALSKALGAPRFSFGSPDMLVAALGIAPGAVTPFAVINAAPGTLSVVLDQGMLGRDPLNFHPLRNDRTTAVAGADLLAFIAACGHAPRLMILPERAA